MIRLAEISTRAPKGLEKDDLVRKRLRMSRHIGELQHILYAQKKHSLLVVMQGMDASGKDGATRKVFQYCNPKGIDALPFGKPTEEEFAHDFLWRVTRRAPAKGFVHVFIRSHYEDVLIQRVNKWIDEDRVTARFEAINAWETLLHKDNGTTILKFYLHISAEKQAEKLQSRIDNPEEQWKHNAADWKEREQWPAYMAAYEDAVNRSVVPWHVIPADQKWYRDFLIAETVVRTLEGLDLSLPTLQADED